VLPNRKLPVVIVAIALLVASGARWAARAEESVSFPSNDADLTGGAPTTLTGVLYRPRDDGPFAAIVLMHGCGGLRDKSGRLAARHADWAQRFHGLGYVVLHVDSFTPRGVPELCTVKNRPVNPNRERVRDAYGALLYLQSLPFVRADRIGLMGWSHGGSTVLSTVAEQARGRPRTLDKGDFRAAVAFYPGCRASLQSRTWTTRIPLEILHGEKDDWTPIEPCRALVLRVRTAGAPVELVTYPNAFHGFDTPNSAVRVRKDVATTPTGTATVGTDPKARADAITRVPEYFARHLGSGS
jgi:dienelactone hydrolase